jgi:hypothetical protein
MSRLPLLLPLLSLLTLTLACGGGSVSVSVAPASAIVTVGKTLQLSASVTGSSNTAVSWTVSGVQGGTINLGSVSNTGLYTAAISIPAVTRVTITAVSQADPTKSASSTVTVVPAGSFTNATLKGTYVFQLFQPNTPYAYFAGEVTADGNGNLSDGIVDTADTTTWQLQFQQGVTGNYSIAPDGRGSVTLGTRKFEVALASTNGGQMVSFDTNTVVGTIQLLDSSAAGSPFAGPYVLELEGGSMSFYGSSYIGSISFNSDLTLSGTGFLGLTSQTVNQATFSGTYQMPDPSTGRGTAAVTVSVAPFVGCTVVTFNLVFYRWNASQLALMGTDTYQCNGVPVIELHSGLAFPQTASLSSFPLDMTFTDWVDDRIGNQGTITGASRATLDNNGTVTDARFGGDPPISGTYSTSAQGLILNLPSAPNVQPLTFVMAASTQQGVELYFGGQNTGDGYPVASAGVTAAQAPGPYQNTALEGNYTFGACTFPGNGDGYNYLMAVGQFYADGNGNLKGLWDVTAQYVTAQYASPTFNLTAVNVSGTYSVNPDGSGVIHLSSDPLPGQVSYPPISFVIQNQQIIGADCTPILKQQ